MSRLAPKVEVIRALFALSGNQCAFPGCNHPLISEKGAFIAQLCHIEAANSGGERFNIDQTDEERRSISNLMLLCYAHHTETDNVNEYPVSALQEMKRAHEEQFQGKYELPADITSRVTKSIEAELDKIFALAQDTNHTVHKIEDMLNRVLVQPTISDDKYYISQLDSIKSLKKQGKYNTVIELLIDFKENNWAELNPEIQYKVLVNLGMCYLDLYDPERAAEFFVALDDVSYVTTDKIPLICLGFAIQRRYKEFDNRFGKERQANPESINLWIGYIERHKSDQTIDEILEEVPASAKTSIPVLVHIGTRLIADGKKKEGLSVLRKTLEHPQLNSESLNDTKALVATYIMQEVIDPFSYKYKNYTTEELVELEHAKNLFSQVWQEIGNTEIAPSKWYIIGNRGVINRIIGTADEALEDLKKAWELSKEFVPFKNFFVMLLDLKKFTAAEQLISNHSFNRKLTTQENFEKRALQSELLCLQGRYPEAIQLLTENLNKENREEYLATVSDIATICISYNDTERAEFWSERLIKEFPIQPVGYIISGTIRARQTEFSAALALYCQAQDLITSDTSKMVIFQLAAAFMHIEEYARAIPLFERIANTDILNDLSRGLISAHYRYGDLQAATAIAEKLFLIQPKSYFLCEIIANICEETRQFDKAIDTIQVFLPFANLSEADLLNFRIARLYSFKKEWDSVNIFASKIKHPENLSLRDSFNLAYLLMRSGAWDAGISIAFNARTNFYDDSGAHSRYIQIFTEQDREPADIFPNTVNGECAVLTVTDSGEKKTYVITDKNTREENALKPSDSLAQLLKGKTKGQTINISKGYGLSYNLTIVNVIEIYTYAFQQSMRLFEDRFAGQEGIGILVANPGGANDEVEHFIKHKAANSNVFEKQVYGLYEQKGATLGVLSHLFKRNPVMQWLSMLSSSDISLISLTSSEIEAVESTVTNNKPVVLELTALLTTFFLSRNDNFLALLKNKIIVSQSTVDEIVECFDDLEYNARHGRFILGFERGNLATHLVSKESIIEHREILLHITEWCKSNAQIVTASKLLNVNREDRERLSNVLGACFYETILIAKEYGATVISDDDHFKRLIRSEYGNLTFSIHQLAQWMVRKELITQSVYQNLCMQLVISNHVYIPLTHEQLWECFDKSGFQINKPFTVGVRGLLVMEVSVAANNLVKFFKKLYLENGLATTRDQIILFSLSEVSKRKDFSILKPLIVLNVSKEFRLIQKNKDELLNLLTSFY